MATPTLTTDLVTLHACDSVTGAEGNKPVLEGEIKKEGDYSLGFTVTINKTSGVSFTSVDLTGKTSRIWYASITFPNMDTKANGGLRFYATDGSSNTAYWLIAGSDTYFGGWINVVVDMDSTPDSGSFDKSDVEEIGLEIATLSTPKNLTNTWIDYARYGAGITATGGTAFTSGNYITLKDIAAEDKSNGYGIVEENVITGEIALFGEVNIGNGATTTYHKEVRSAATFADVNVSSTLYKMLFQGSGCHASLDGFTVKGYNQTFTLDANDSGLNELTMAGCAVGNADAVYFKAGQSITNCVFDSCGQIDPATATFQNNTISGYAGAEGALLLPTVTTNLSDLSFMSSGAGHAIYVSATGTRTLSGIVYSGYGADDTTDAEVYNNSGGLVTLDISGNGDSPTVRNGSGATTQVNATVNVTIAANVTLVGAEIRIYDLDTTPPEYGTELAGVESCPTSTYGYAGEGGNVILIQIMKDGYVEYAQEYTMPTNDSDLNVVLQADENI